MDRRGGFSRGIFLVPALFLVLTLPAGCGEGWDAYKDFYDIDLGGTPGEPWTGAQKVNVVRDAQEVETLLQGIVTAGFHTGSGLVLAAVRLSDLIEHSGITASPEQYRYDFTAADGYNLLKKRGNDVLKLPDWETMHHGYLYVSDIGDLRVGWDDAEQPWGSAVSAYNVKYMDNGILELLEP